MKKITSVTGWTVPEPTLAIQFQRSAAGAAKPYPACGCWNF